jgi:hypothetical protein
VQFDAEFQHFILWDLIKFHYFANTIERQDRGWKQAQRQGNFMDNSIDSNLTEENCVKQIQTTKSSSLHWPKEKENSGLRTTLTFSWTLKKVMPLHHFHWYFKLLTNLSNPGTHLIVSSLKITKIQNSNHQIQQFHWSNHLFCTPTHKHIQTPSM